jgi:hypothetical protein
MVISYGDLSVFVRQPVCAVFLGFSLVLILAQMLFALRGQLRSGDGHRDLTGLTEGKAIIGPAPVTPALDDP